jgi:large conductance mechanosensitive channel
MIKEFKEFAMRGNVVDLAVGVVIGGAFGKIVTSLVADVIMPVIGVVTGGINFTDHKIVLKAAVEATETLKAVPAVTLNWGSFVQSAVDFLIIAFCIFLVVKLINTLKKAEPAPAPAAVEDTKTEKLLADIRDLLKK